MLGHRQRRRFYGAPFLRTLNTCGLASLVIALMALAACGNLGAGTPHLATPTATRSSVNPGGLVVRSCPGPTISIAPTAKIIVNERAQSQPIAAHSGDSIQIRLPAGAQRWNENGAPDATLTPQTTQGAYVSSLNACVWAFQAARSGVETLHFDGQPLCEPNQPCANYALAVSVTFSVS